MSTREGPCRTWLFVPGHKERMVQKVQTLDSDAIIFDLQDAVPGNQRDAARATIRTALAEDTSAERYVRTQPVGDAELSTDLQAVTHEGLTGVVIPKVDEVSQIQEVEGMLIERESMLGLPSGSTAIVAMVESATGLLNAPAIGASSARLTGLLFGAEDFALDLGLPSLREGEGDRLLYARSSVAVAAASAGVQAIDKVFLDVRDADSLMVDTKESRQLGFTGKCVIHPEQLETVHSAFRPSEAELAHARRVVEAFEASEGGALAVDGKMVDAPVIDRARRVLKMGEA